MAISQSSHHATSPTAPALDNTVPYGVSHFYLNHPRNYLVVPIAVTHPLDTASLIQKHAAGSGSQAKSGAEVLGLINSDGSLTERGETVVATSADLYESPTAALKDLHDLHGSSDRFIDERPQWAETAREIALAYEPARAIATILQDQGETTLPELLVAISESTSEAFARDLFINSETEIPLKRLEATDSLSHPSIYKGTVVFQLKSFLYHCGILKSRGVDTANLIPDKQTWALTEQAHSIVEEPEMEER